MLYWALIIIVFAVIAGALAFGGVAGASAGVAQILMAILIGFVIISGAVSFFRRS